MNKPTADQMISTWVPIFGTFAIFIVLPLFVLPQFLDFAQEAKTFGLNALLLTTIIAASTLSTFRRSISQSISARSPLLICLLGLLASEALVSYVLSPAPNLYARGPVSERPNSGSPSDLLNSNNKSHSLF